MTACWRGKGQGGDPLPRTQGMKARTEPRRPLEPMSPEPWWTGGIGCVSYALLIGSIAAIIVMAQLLFNWIGLD